MKGISTIIAYVLVIAISVSAVAIALSVGNPSIEKTQEILLLNQGKENLKIIDNAINQVLQEGSGSSREISLTSIGGNYKIAGNNVTFTMQTKQQIVAPGASGSDGVVFVDAMQGEIAAYVEYVSDFIGEKEFGKGAWNLIISNENGQIRIA